MRCLSKDINDWKRRTRETSFLFFSRNQERENTARFLRRGRSRTRLACKNSRLSSLPARVRRMVVFAGLDETRLWHGVSFTCLKAPSLITPRSVQIREDKSAVVSCYCFIIVAVVIVLGQRALFLLFVLLYSQRIANHSCETLREWTTSSPSFALSVVRDTLSPPCVTQKMAARDPGVRRTLLLRASRPQDFRGHICFAGFLSRHARRTKRKRDYL